MKKIISIFLSIIVAAGLCFGVAGCKEEEKDPINYTAKAPLCKYEWEKPNYETRTPSTIKGYTYVEKFNDYGCTADYYKENLQGSNIYILNYGYELDGCALYEGIDSNRLYEIYKNKTTTDLIIYNSFTIFDEELGSVYGKQKLPPGKSHYSLSFVMYTKSVKNHSNDKFLLEFGKSKEKASGESKYINIYSGEECFATCYFDAGKIKITEQWFENYFKENLVWGDSL